MSTVKVYQCDGPGCEVSAAPHRLTQDLPPEEWWRVKKHGREELQFHSIECLLHWAYAYQWAQQSSEEAS